VLTLLSLQVATQPCAIGVLLVGAARTATRHGRRHLDETKHGLQIYLRDSGAESSVKVFSADASPSWSIAAGLIAEYLSNARDVP